MPQKTLDQLLDERDYPDDVRDAVANEIAKNGNEGRIVLGELHLPARQDAIHWHDRMMGRYGLNEDEKRLEQRIQDLEAQLKEQKPQPPEE